MNFVVSSCIFCLITASSYITSAHRCGSPLSIDDSYAAAVVDYHPEGNPVNDTANEILAINVANYEKFIETASKQEADIVVFPEYGLTQVWPVRERSQLRKYAQVVPNILSSENDDTFIPCLSFSANDSWVIKKISCSARNNHIYVVINIPEIVHCLPQEKDCPEDGFFLYNSNVAFDRYGAVTAKYWKYHPFVEVAINRPVEASYSIFTTDFGVKFGIFTCFDILYKEPAFNLVAIKNITDFVFPTAWFSELPFLTAVQTQASWSLGLGVNLLASDYNDIEKGCGGSGIYSGTNGVLASHIPSVTESNLIIARVPKIDKIKPEKNDPTECHQTQPTMRSLNNRINLKLMYLDLSHYVYSDPLKEGVTESQLCHNNLCCQFYADIKLVNSTTKRTYRFAAFDGIRSHASGQYLTGSQVCAIIYCLNDNFATCSHLPDVISEQELFISTLKISGNLTSSQMILPNTVNFELQPISLESFDFIMNGNNTMLSSKKKLENVLSISIYGRNFHVDN